MRMHSHGLRKLVDDKSVASYQQTSCEFIAQTCYPKACCNLFRPSCNKSANDTLQQAGKIDDLQQVCGLCSF